MRILRRLFLSDEPLACKKAADVDDDGRLNLTDAVRILRHLFLGGEPPPAPYPACGLDPTADPLACGGACR